MNTEIILLIALISSIVLTEICRYLQVPRAVGQVSAGILVSTLLPITTLTTQNMDALSFLANVGLFMLFFFVGLGINVRDITHNVKAGIVISLLNTLIPLGASLALMPLLGFDIVSSLIIGICLAVSSQSAGVDFLDELGLLKTRLGKLIVTAGAVDDLVEFTLIAFVLALINSALQDKSVPELLIGFTLYFASVLAFRYFFLPFFLKFLEKEKSISNLFLGSVCILFLVAVLGEALGIGALIGAFTAGMLVRHTLLTGKKRRPWEEWRIAHNTRIVAFGFFVPIFFFWTGYTANILDVLSDPQFTLIAIAIAFTGTIGGTIAGAMLTGHTFREGLLAGWGVNAKGDTELAIATTALQVGAITTSVFSGLIVMSIAATLISPIAFRVLVHHNKMHIRNPTRYVE